MGYSIKWCQAFVAHTFLILYNTGDNKSYRGLCRKEEILFFLGGSSLEEEELLDHQLVHCRWVSSLHCCGICLFPWLVSCVWPQMSKMFWWLWEEDWKRLGILEIRKLVSWLCGEVRGREWIDKFFGGKFCPFKISGYTFWEFCTRGVMCLKCGTNLWLLDFVDNIMQETLRA